jgi:hypothetical protein
MKMIMSFPPESRTMARTASSPRKDSTQMLLVTLALFVLGASSLFIGIWMDAFAQTASTLNVVMQNRTP